MKHLSVRQRAVARQQDTLPSVLCVVYVRYSEGSVTSEDTAEMFDKQTVKAEAPPPFLLRRLSS